MTQIHPETEKNLVLNAQNVYDILDMSIQAADDNGFVNEFVYDRVIYVFLASYLCPKHTIEISNIISETNPLEAWDYCCNENLILEMQEKYPHEISFVEDIKVTWLRNYVEYAHSARGLLNTIQEFTSDIVNQTVNKFNKINEGSDVQQVLEIAEKWGLNEAVEELKSTEIVEETEELNEPDLLSLYESDII